MSVESLVLILIVVDNGLVLEMKLINDIDYEVLILIVVDNGLVLGILGLQVLPDTGLNPYCSGQWSRTIKMGLTVFTSGSLNPYCSGQWSRTRNEVD